MKLKIALLHLSDQRPHIPVYHGALLELGTAAKTAVTALGWECEAVAGNDLPLHESVAVAADADAIVILGGEDVAPEFYGGTREYDGSGEYLLRADAAHLIAVHTALRAGQPVLGICRGLQLINVALGGTLIQHLKTGGRHRLSAPGMQSFATNAIELAPDGDYDQDLVADAVRCSHHQAIDALGEGLVVAGRAHDGIIEAAVHESAPITGVQWHPEHPETAAEQLTPLLRRLERQAAQR